MVFFWMGSSLLQDAKLARTILLAFSIGSTTLALGALLELPGFSAAAYDTIEGRETVLGMNPNYLGYLTATGALILLGLSLDSSVRFTTKAVFALFTLLQLAVMINSGSRAAVGGFLLGGLFYLLPHWGGKLRVNQLTFAILGLAAVVYMVAASPGLRERLEKSYYEGDTAGRDTIVVAAFEMFLERPIFGWGPVELWYQLGSRLGLKRRDVHNTPLHLLVEVGIVGAIPFFLGLWSCGWSAWRARSGRFGFVPVALFVAILAVNMADTFLTTKAFWLVVSFALTAGFTPVYRTGTFGSKSHLKRSPNHVSRHR